MIDKHTQTEESMINTCTCRSWTGLARHRMARCLLPRMRRLKHGHALDLAPIIHFESKGETCFVACCRTISCILLALIIALHVASLQHANSIAKLKSANQSCSIICHNHFLRLLLAGHKSHLKVERGELDFQIH